MAIDPFYLYQESTFYGIFAENLSSYIYFSIRYQCTEKNVFVYYKAFSSSTTKHGFLGAGMINQPLSTVLCMLKDASKRHLYDKTITTAQVHKKITSNIELGEYFLYYSTYYCRTELIILLCLNCFLTLHNPS